MQGCRQHIGVALAVLTLALYAFPQSPAPLTLKQAVEIALEKNPVRKASLAERNGAATEIRAARSLLLPQLTFTESAMRGNDPVYVFGTRLRQTRFTAADFALNRLNFPTPIGDFTTRFGARWNLFDSFASWANLSRTEKMDKAAAERLARSDQETIFQVVQAYYGLLLVDKQRELAEQTLRTAQAILNDARNRVDAGVAVDSDSLAADANAAVRQQEAIRTRNNVALAQAQLAVALGVPADTLCQPVPETAQGSLPVIELLAAEKIALEQRPELKQVALEHAATNDGVRMAKAAFGPRISTFAQWEADNPTFLSGGGGNNWMGGLELQFDLFAGGQKSAQLAKAKAMEQRVSALQEAATQGVRLEVRRAYYDMDTTHQTIQVAQAAVRQAEEGLRINQDRYTAGLATVTDLLRAEEAAHSARTSYWQALYGYQTAYANLELAMGRLTAASPVVR